MPDRKAAVETTIRLDFLATTLNEMKADLKALPDRMASQYATKEELMQVKQDYQTIRSDIKELSSKMDSRDNLYITKDQFDPVKRVVYGLVGLTLIAVFTAIINFVLQK
jgi:predicted  nucleic acid-binding Zn-ribbon protein